MSLLVLSWLVAFVGMCYELCLAQYLAVTLGDTFLRYTTTVGIFTLTLGAMSLIYDRFADKIHKKHYFVLSQFLLFVVAYISQFWIPFFGAENPILCHIPLFFIGFISGYELPYLIREALDHHKNKVLAFDYFGMFSATILFPLLLFPFFGVKNVLLILGGINLLTAIFFYRTQIMKRQSA